MIPFSILDLAPIPRNASATVALTNTLAGAETSIRAAARHPAEITTSPHVEAIHLPDLMSDVDWTPLLTDVDAVVHLAGIAHAGPGIGEELFFRGLMMRSLLEKTHAAAAVTVSAVLFGLIHFDVLQSPGAALIGVYLGIVAYRSDSLVPAMIAHGANNLLCALFARFSDETDQGPIELGHPPWIIVTASLVFTASVLLFFRATRKRSPSEHAAGEGGIVNPTE